MRPQKKDLLLFSAKKIEQYKINIFLNKKNLVASSLLNSYCPPKASFQQCSPIVLSVDILDRTDQITLRFFLFFPAQ